MPRQPRDSLFLDCLGKPLHGPDRKTADILRRALAETTTVIEFGGLLDEFFTHDQEVVKDALEEAHDLIDSASPFPFPFPFFALSWHEIDQIGMPAANIAIVVESPENPDIFASLGMIFRSPSTGGGWFMNPLVVGYQRPGVGEARLRISPTMELPPGALQLISPTAAIIAGNVLAACVLLARPGSAIAEDLPTKESNQLRRARKLPPAPPIRRVIHINRVAVRRPAGAGTGQGSPKAPHDRRGHLRHYASGKVVMIRPCAIKGGTQALRIYDVED